MSWYSTGQRSVIVDVEFEEMVERVGEKVEGAIDV